MSQYRYLAVDLLTGNVLAELPLYGVYFTRKLNGIGDFTGTFKLGTAAMPGTLGPDSTTPGRTVVYVDRDGVLLGPYIIWTRTYSAQSLTMELSGRTPESYAARRLMQADFLRTGAEQRNMMVDLWNIMQKDAYSNIRVQVPPPFPTVVPRDYNVHWYDFKTFGDAMNEVLASDNSFDWTIDAEYINDVPSMQLSIGYPQLGQSFNSGLVFEYPGNILQFDYSEQAGSAGNTFFAIGNGEGTARIWRAATDGASMLTGTPRLDVDVTYDINDTTTLQARANALKNQLGTPIAVLSAFVRADIAPILGTYGLGDNARFVLTDARFPNTTEFHNRVIGWEVRPGESDNSEEIQLTFQGA